MGTKLSNDIIAVPSHSLGVITLPPSLLTLGGRQFRTAALSRTISADVTLVANTLYFVYAQLVSGVPALRISTTVPSGYKLANPTSLLVTAFYSNGLSSIAFGSFVNIEGKPKTRTQVNWLPTGPLVSNTNYSVNSAWWRDGATGIFQASASFTGSPGAFANLGVDVPANLVMDTNNALLSEVAGGANIIGICFYSRDSNSWIGELNYQSTTRVVARSRRVQGSYIDTLNVTDTIPTANFANTDGMMFKFSPVAIVGWSDTPLVNL